MEVHFPAQHVRYNRLGVHRGGIHLEQVVLLLATTIQVAPAAALAGVAVAGPRHQGQFLLLDLLGFVFQFLQFPLQFALQLERFQQVLGAKSI